MKRIRTLALFMAAAMLLVLLASTAFVVCHADHDCDGACCLTCQQISLCTQHLKTVAAAAAAFLLLAMVLGRPGALPLLPPPATARRTLVAQKVKLTN